MSEQNTPPPNYIDTTRVIQPSLASFCRYLTRYLASHNLMIRPLVFHPVTYEHIPVSYWRNLDGIPTEDGLVCTIVPAYTATRVDSPSPLSASASVIYSPYDIGRERGADEAIYHFLVKFYYREPSYDGLCANFLEDKKYVEVPLDAVVFPHDKNLTTSLTKDITYQINPPMEIICNYLELTRLAMYSYDECSFPFPVNSIEAVHINYPTANYLVDENAIIHQGHIFLRITTFNSRGWELKLKEQLNNISLEFFNTGLDEEPVLVDEDFI